MEQKESYIFKVVNCLSLENLHLRKLSRRIGINHMKTKRILDSLIKKNIVDFIKEGRNKVFFLKNNLSSRAMFICSELYKQIEILSKNPELKPIFEEIISNSSIKLAILFGSYAKGTQNKQSDIDIYIETNSPNVKEKLELLNSRISVKTELLNKNNYLFKEIIKNHVIIKGVEEFYERIKN